MKHLKVFVPYVFVLLLFFLSKTVQNHDNPSIPEFYFATASFMYSSEFAQVCIPFKFGIAIFSVWSHCFPIKLDAVQTIQSYY